MSRSHKKLLPIGCNMNDAAYPFRGEYKVAAVINHGHSGVSKRAPTSLALRVTGANLVIEQIRVPKGATMECELAVDGGVPRPVALGGADSSPGSALAVPGDGRNYHVTAVVKTDQGKHYCKMVFNGSEGQSVLRLRAPTQGPADAVQLFIDGKRVRPVGGWYSVPLRAADCSLVLNTDCFPAGSASPFLPFIGQAAAPEAPGWTAAGAAAVPTNMIIETVPGVAATAQLQCTKTGQSYDLGPNTATAIPANAGPYRLHLPAPPSTAAPAAAAPAPLASLLNPPQALSTTTSTAGGSGGLAPTLELEARPHTGPDGSYAYTVTASSPGGPASPSPPSSFTVQLTTEGGATASGLGTATVALPHRRAQQVVVTVVSATNPGHVLLRQRQHIAAQQPAPVALHMQEEPATGALLFRGGPGSCVSVAPANAAAAATPPVPTTMMPGTARVDRSAGPQTVSVEQTNPDGSVTAATIGVDGKPRPQSVGMPFSPFGVVPPAVPGTPAATAAGAASLSSDPIAAALTRWVAGLAEALQAPSLEEARRRVGEAVPPTAPASTVTNFVCEQLSRAPPSFSFSTQPTGLAAVSCGGLDVKAAVGGGPVTPVGPGGSVSIPAGSYAVLTACPQGSDRPAASVRVGNSGAGGLGLPPMSGSAAFPMPASPYGPSAAGGPSAEEALVAWLIDAIQRNGMDPAKVADQLAAIPAATLSPSGVRLVPLLVHTLRRAAAPAPSTAAAGADRSGSSHSGGDDILFTCGNGFLAEIRTAQPHYQITASVDGQAPIPVPQRSRLPPAGIGGSAFPTSGQPHFVELAAWDPVTGLVKKTVRLCVMGAEEGTPAAAQFGPRVAPYAPTPQQQQQQTTCATAPPSSSSFSAAAHAGSVPYLDVTLQQTGEDVQLRCATRSGHRIVCEVDSAGGGSTGLSDFVAKLSGARPHRVELTVLDPQGQVAFQQRLEVPAMASGSWGVAVQDGGLALDPDGGCVATVSVDRAPERAVQGNFLSLVTDAPHYVVLRKYLSGVNGARAGELALRLPGFITPADIEALAKLYRRHIAGGLDVPGLRQELAALRNRATSPAMRELVDALLDALSGGTGGGGASRGAVHGATGRVYFRLTGSD